MQQNNIELEQRNTEYYESINPFTEEIIENYPYDAKEQLLTKLKTSHEAFKKWSSKSLEERSEPIVSFANVLKEKKEEFAKFVVKEMGKPYQQAVQEIELCAQICNYAVDKAPEFLRDEEAEFENGKAFITYQPQGVILSIQPWNFPFYQAIRYAIPNIIAGNTTLLSHAASVWGSAKNIESALIEAGLPKGVFQLIYPQSEDIEVLYHKREVRGVTFTGSPSTGKKIAQEAGKNLKKTVLELGGSDAYIVTENADIEKAVASCVEGRIGNNGQTCTAAKRFIVVEKVYEDFKKKFVQAMSEVQTGDPMEKTTKLGPLVRKDLLEKLNEQVEESLDMGAKCLTGGNIMKKKGFFFEPTVLENLRPGMPAYDEELFGPVASLIKAKDLDDAIEIANSSRFGLGGGIFGDESEVVKVAKNHFDTGMVDINGYSSAKPNLPFGGVKDSGYGREHARFGFHEFLNIKCVKIHK